MYRQKAPPRLRTVTYRVKRSYFVTFCVLHRDRVFADRSMAAAARDVIIRYREQGYYYLPAYCVMPDHIHLLLIPSAENRHLSRIVATLKNSILVEARWLRKALKWQWGYYDRLLRRSEETPAFAEYVVMNPVREGLVGDYRDYEFAGFYDGWG